MGLRRLLTTIESYYRGCGKPDRADIVREWAKDVGPDEHVAVNSDTTTPPPPPSGPPDTGGDN